MPRIDLLNRLVKPNLGNILLCILFSAIIWFMPEMFGIYDISANVDVLFMKQFVLWSYNMLTARIIGFFATIAIYLWLMHLSAKLQILPKRSTMPFFIGMTLTSAINYNQVFDEGMIVIFLFIIALQQLISMYHFEKQVVAGFNIILLLCFASLFVSQYIWLSLLFVLGMIIFRIIKKRVFFSILLGIATAVVLGISIFWLFNQYAVIAEYSRSFLDFSITPNIAIQKSDIIFIIVIFLLILFTNIACLVTSSKYKLNVRLNFTFISWCFWISLAWLMLFTDNINQLLIVPEMFAVLCLSLYFTSHHKKLANIIFIVYSVMIISYRIVWCLGL